MKVIGIVGGMGAGKSTVIRLMNEVRPISYILADNVGHDVLLKGHEAYEPVIEAFGKEILDDNGQIIRKKLGEIVFKDPEKLRRLNEITHPIIEMCIRKQIATYQEEAPERPILLEAALLLESGLVDLTDLVVAVYAEPSVRVQRVVEREGLTKEQILERFKAQKEWEEIKAVADYIIDNSVSLEETKEQIKALFEKL